MKAPSPKRDQNTLLPPSASAISESRAYCPTAEGEALSYTVRAFSSVTRMRSSPETSSRAITWPTLSPVSVSSEESEEAMTAVWPVRLLRFSENTRSREAMMG